MVNTVGKSIQRKIMNINENTLLRKKNSFKILENGSCRLCKKCNYQIGLDCKYPEKMRYSLEATGVNVNDLANKCFDMELDWYYKGKSFPKYQCIVSAILTNEPSEVINIYVNSINLLNLE